MRNRLTSSTEWMGLDSVRLDGLRPNAKLLLGGHACGFFEADRQQWITSLRLLESSLDCGTKAILVSEPPNISLVQKLISQSPLRDWPITLTTTEQLMGSEALPVGEMLSRWEQLVRGAVAEGYSGVCAVTEMIWALRNPAICSQLAEYEARLNEHFTRLPLGMLCLYDRHLMPEELLLDALHTHPIVFVGGEPHDNPYYLPREVLLSDNRRDEFTWYLSKLSQAKLEQTDAQTYLPTDNSGWQVYCLGELRVLRAGKPIIWDAAHGATRRVKALFAYLLEQGKNGAPKEKLADLLWPDESDLERSLSRLYHTVHALRMALEPGLASADASHYVLSDEERYVLVLPNSAFRDADAFENLCRRGELAYKAREDNHALSYYLPAERLYAGDLFSDIPGTCAERLDDDWCWSRRYWLRDMYLKLMLHLAEIYLRQSSIAQSLHYWQRALKLDPCCEEAHRGMMRAFHCAGRPDALARQYHICERQLRRQENRPPDSQTLALWQSLVGKKGTH